MHHVLLQSALCEKPKRLCESPMCALFNYLYKKYVHPAIVYLSLPMYFVHGKNVKEPASSTNINISGD